VDAHSGTLVGDGAADPQAKARSAGVTVKGVVGLVVLAGIVGGALLGALMRRRPSMSPSRSLDSDRIDVQAGWRNMQGG
jgi:hypothetical protein